MFKNMWKTVGLVIFVLAVLTNKCRSQCCRWPCNDALRFAGDSTGGYGISRGLQTSLKRTSVCFWFNIPATYANSHAPTVVSYATSGGSDNELLLYFVKGCLIVHRRSLSITIPTNAFTADGKNHHVCVTWDLSNGPLSVYVDGKHRFGVEKKTTNVPAGGTWILGQDQDKFEGGFTKMDSMKGILAEVNIWDRILGPYEIAALASGCGPLVEGNVKSPNDFEITGEVQKFKPVYCHGS